MATDTVPDDRAGCERVFRRNGLPLLIEGHTVGRDVFGRAAPFLVLLMLVSTAGAVDLNWPVWANVLAVTGAAVAICAAFAGVNVLRGRPWRTLPQEVGVAELVVFVLVPAAVSVLIGGHWKSALVIVAVNLLALATLRYLVGYGVLATVWWGLARVVDELGASLLRLIRLLPLLLLFSVMLFYATEIWQVFDRTATVPNLLLGAFFTIVILTLVMLRVRTEASSALRDAARAVPGGEDATDLTRAQRTNLYAMIGVSQLLQVLVVSAAMGVFFVALGTLTVTADTMKRWGVTGGTWTNEVAIGDARLLMSTTLIRVAVAIATFTGLYYAISVQVDPMYRTEFVSGVGGQLRHVLMVRIRYRELLGTSPAGPAAAEEPPQASPAVPGPTRDRVVLDRPEIVCLCGSARFVEETREANRDLTFAGVIVVAPGEAGEPVTDEQKRVLDALHLRKIDLADRVLVVNPGGYVGESTSKEIAYARARGKPVSFTDPV